MDIKEQASIILSSIQNYKKSFISDLLLTEGKYISDIFIQVTNEIIKKIEDDLTTGCFCLNTDYYTNYCYNPEMSEPFFALPFQKKHHPIYIRYVNDKNDNDDVMIYVEELGKCLDEDSPIIIVINLNNYDDIVSFKMNVLSALSDEYTHIVQLYNEKRIIPDNMLYQKYEKYNWKFIDKQKDKVIYYILYLFSSYEREAHISSVEFNFDRILNNAEREKIKSIDSNKEKINYVASLFSKEHSLGLFVHSIELLTNNYINALFDFVPVLIIGYYLQNSGLIDTDITEREIKELQEFKTTPELQVFYYDHKDLLKRYSDISEIVTTKIHNTFIEYKNEVFELITNYLINEHLLNINVCSSVDESVIYSEIVRQFNNHEYVMCENLETGHKYSSLFPRLKPYYKYSE